MKLSNLELDVMRLIWREKEVIVPDLHAEMAKERDITYATIKTIVNRLEEKGAIERIRSYGRTILYGPLVKERDMARPIVKDVLRRLFGDQVRPMISHLLKVEKLSVEDLEFLESQIAAELGKRESGGKPK
ncbi:MAG: BlaI/MecI/CopY family transcriptional regulator [Pseudomonadales bacterium]|nr:BlaI/MecI/CopY family transcriptional regulator [Pseudomonadales bacterium]